ncbi:MAG: hypothetical protein EBS86_14395, partial [Crocinitomicaceae bacterium]|nr:hypothetical protein [Crocinitomicaceae bacterium]
PIIDGISTHEILSMENNNYIQHMRNSSTWGGAIEISAACNLWNVKIIVYDIRTQQRTAIEFIPINLHGIASQINSISISTASLIISCIFFCDNFSFNLLYKHTANSACSASSREIN